MQKTKIEWADYSWNPVKGICPNNCWYCYARAMYKRFKWNSEIRLNESEIYSPAFNLNPKLIFVGSTIDLFHDDIPSKWIRRIIGVCGVCCQHTYVFLTKFPARYAEFDFPKNCWLGVTVTGPQDVWRIEQMAINFGKSVGELLHGGKRPPKLNLPFVSLEPFLEPIPNLGDSGFGFMDWVIMGALTGPKAKQHQPKKEWIEKIMKFYVDRWEQQNQNKSALFLKNNLKSIWGTDLIQEWPSETDRRIKSCVSS